MKKLLVILAIAFIGCKERQELTKTAIIATIHSDKPIHLEVLHQYHFQSGIYKAYLDSSEYVIVKTHNGVAIIKHK